VRDAQDPLLFLQNITGFIVGKEFEHGGSPATAPKWCTRSRQPGAQVHRDHRRLVRRGKLRDVRPRVLAAPLWMWPSAKISVMGGQQAADVLWT
jgi:3-methylcrotonyl-CoA carboxylase beta subunit